MKINVEKLTQLSMESEKSPYGIVSKIMEEAGEVASAYSCVAGESGMAYKGFTIEDVREECVDVFMAAYSLYIKLHGEPDAFNDILARKCKKWEAVVAIK